MIFDGNLGIAVGGDYTQQSDNVNNIATTSDGGEPGKFKLLEKMEVIKRCVKIRPKSKGKDVIAVGRPGM